MQRFKKKLYDNLFSRGWTEEDVKFRKNEDGESMADVIKRDFFTNLETGEPVMGATYWANIKQKWQNENSAYSQLEPDPVAKAGTPFPNILNIPKLPKLLNLLNFLNFLFLLKSPNSKIPQNPKFPKFPKFKNS